MKWETKRRIERKLGVVKSSTKEGSFSVGVEKVAPNFFMTKIESSVCPFDGKSCKYVDSCDAIIGFSDDDSDPCPRAKRF